MKCNSGLYYYRARIYSPGLGRFLQTDPIGYYDAMNLYQYCGNNPVNYIDPSGTDRYIISDSVGLHRSIAVDQYKMNKDGVMEVSGQRRYSIESKNYWTALWKSKGKWQNGKSVYNDNNIFVRDRVLLRVKSTYEEDMILQQVIDIEIGENPNPSYGILTNLGESTWCVPYSYGRLFVGMSRSDIAKVLAKEALKKSWLPMQISMQIWNLLTDHTTPAGTVVETDKGKPEVSQ